MARSEVLGFVLRTEFLCTPFWAILGFHSLAKVGYDSPEGQIPLCRGTGGGSIFCMLGPFSVL